MRQPFEHLREAGLAINLTKCEIRKGQVTYLGHQVGQGSMRQRTAKVQAISNLPAPKSKVNAPFGHVWLL